MSVLGRRRILRFGLLLSMLTSGLVKGAGVDEIERLKKLLGSIERALPQEVLNSLLPSATEEDLARLREIVLRGEEIPADIMALLRWHNGQHWNAPLSPNNNRRLLSAAEMIDQWSFFQDPTSDFLKPWRDSWLPVLTNDSGDYVVYETQGSRRGQLIQYWHDDERRSVAYVSLQTWAEKLLNEFENA